jgi:hypothetical protein
MCWVISPEYKKGKVHSKANAPYAGCFEIFLLPGGIQVHPSTILRKFKLLDNPVQKFITKGEICFQKIITTQDHSQI